MLKNIYFKHSLYGFLFGAIFPLVSIVVDVLDRDMSISVANIVRVHSLNTLYYIIDLAPIVLGTIAFFISRYMDRLIEEGEKKVFEAGVKSKKYSDYIELLINGNYDFEIELGDLKEDDELEESLKTLRRNLIETEEREKKQNWTTGGLAKFIEVLRSDTNSLSELGDRIISNIVQYIGANQGAIFIKEEENEETVLKLISAYAYEKKKFIDKSIKPGVGLVGTAFSEKSTMNLNEVPSDYIEISSGLGKAKPKAILIVPLLINEEVYGVIELASFKEFKDFEIEFVEKLAENIASTISGIKITEITKKLLEESQLQTEEMRAQEEEMRQNMEELTATQEEMERKEKEYQALIGKLMEDKMAQMEDDD